MSLFQQAKKGKEKLQIVVTTPLIVKFFLKSHIRRLAEYFDVVLVGPLNPRDDEITGLPCDVQVCKISRGISVAKDMCSLLVLMFATMRMRPKIIWAVGPKAGLLGGVVGFLARTRVRLFVFQGEVWASRRGLIRKFLRFFDKITAATSTHLLSVSETDKRFLAAEGVVDERRISVLGAGTICGVDLHKYRADARVRQRVRIELGIGATQKVLVYVGRLTRDKGIIELVRGFKNALAADQDLVLLVVGPEEDVKVSELCAEAGAVWSKVRMVGLTSEVEKYLNASDFLCLPSYREGFGMVVLEAAAMGLPSIGTRVPGLMDAIEDKVTGLLVDLGDEDQLVSAIVKLAKDDGLRRNLGASGRDRVRRDFDADVVVERYVTYIRETYQSKIEV